MTSCLCEGEPGLVVHFEDLLDGVDISGRPQVQTQVVLAGRAHDLLKRQGEENGKKKNSNKMCLAFLIVHMSIDYTNTHLYLLPWQTSPWCKPNQSERYLSQKHPAFKDETKVFSKRFSIKIHRQQLKYY